VAPPKVRKAGDLRETSAHGPGGAVAACSGGASATTTPEPTERPTPDPTPTPTPWTLDVSRAVYRTETTAGGAINVDVTVKNTGTAKSPVTRLNFSELDKSADLHQCKPRCEIEDLPGFGPSAVMGGVAPGKAIKFHVEFVARAVGAIQWTVCLYDDEYLNEVWCGDGNTAIR
jgi:hypothetical protein